MSFNPLAHDHGESGRPAGAAALDLIEGQVTETNEFLPYVWGDDYLRVKVKDFGEGRIEVLIQESYCFAPRVLPFDARRPKREIVAKELDVERSARRARQVVRHRCMSMGADHLLTLTQRENVTDLGEFRRRFDKFRRAMQKVGLMLHFCAVPERQQRGAWHMHIAVKGFIPVRLVRELWRRIVPDGNIDAQRFSGAPANRIAAYIAKYVGKTFADPDVAGRSRYVASRGYAPPVKREWDLYTRDWYSAIKTAFLEGELSGAKVFDFWFASHRGMFWLSTA